MAASFLTVAIICMFLCGLDEKTVTEAFINGASSLVGVSLIIGLARGVNLIMENGLISDTLLYWASNAVAGMSGPLFILMMMVMFFLLGFIVPSSSGLAVLAMPILAPLADTVGIDRSIVVSAYNWGQYAMLYLAPTGLVMATLTMLDMKYSHWVKSRSPDGWIPVRVRWRPARYPGYGWRLTTVYPYRPRQLNHARRVAIRPRHGTIEAALSPGRLLSFRKGIAAVFSDIRLGFTAALFFAIIRRSSFRDCPS